MIPRARFTPLLWHPAKLGCAVLPMCAVAVASKSQWVAHVCHGRRRASRQSAAMGAMFDYLDAEEGGAEDMIKHALGEVIELNDKICGSPGGPEKIELAARAGLQAATVLLYVYGHAHEEESNWWDRRRPWDESDT